MSTKKLKKTEFIPFLDVSGTETSSWKRVDLSTIFSLNFNPTTETQDYISTETPVEEVTGYNPELEQEIAIYEGNPIYDFLFELFYDLPVGSDVIVPALLCFGGSGKKAWKSNVTIVLGELNTVDGKLTFTMNFGGDIDRGTYSIADGTPTFTPANA